MTRKILCVILVIICLFMFCINLNIKTNKANAEGSKVIDMYLIAGQSNAAGYSIDKPENNEDDMVTETFKNVWYAGQVDRSIIKEYGNITVSSDYTQNFSAFKKEVTVGLGKEPGYIGPEYGMASVLEKYSTTDHPSLIFKTAAGGTSLRKESNKVFGNWYPRSMWESEYEPNIDSINDNGVGILYKTFIVNFKRVYSELVSNGYTPKVQGMAWMQGEEDINNRANYKNLLKTFINDIRKDLSSFAKDESLLSMPFVIGEVCSSFNDSYNGAAMQLAQFQRAITFEMENVTSFSTNDLVIVGQNGAVMGTDRYHYSFKDAKTLGTRFAENLLDLNDKKDILADAQIKEVIKLVLFICAPIVVIAVASSIVIIKVKKSKRKKS